MLLRNFPDLKNELIELRDKDYSFQKIAEHFNLLGYKCNGKTVSRICKNLEIPTNRREYSGSKNPFYGKKHSAETRKKISESRIESGAAKGNKNPMYGKVGVLCPSWKGGTSTKRAIFYASDSWKDIRLKVFSRDNFTCKQCGFTPKNERNTLNAHHIVPLYVNWDLSLDMNNIITLCTDCHKKTFSKEKELIPFFQDIVRTSRRLEEANRNDLLEQ